MKHVDAIARYIELLKAYNERVNVYSRRSYDRLDFHVQDSLYLAQLVSNQPFEVMDMGSGSGFPSVILAIMNPRNQVTAVESKVKKADFLSWVGRELSLENYRVVNQDVREYIARGKPNPHVVTAKAFASYEDISKIIRPLLGKKMRLIVPISKAQYEELAVVPRVSFDLSFSQEGFYYLLNRYEGR